MPAGVGSYLTPVVPSTLSIWWSVGLGIHLFILSSHRGLLSLLDVQLRSPTLCASRWMHFLLPASDEQIIERVDRAFYQSEFLCSTFFEVSINMSTWLLLKMCLHTRNEAQRNPKTFFLVFCMFPPMKRFSAFPIGDVSTPRAWSVQCTVCFDYRNSCFVGNTFLGGKTAIDWSASEEFVRVTFLMWCTWAHIARNMRCMQCRSIPIA